MLMSSCLIRPRSVSSSCRLAWTMSEFERCSAMMRGGRSAALVVSGAAGRAAARAPGTGAGGGGRAGRGRGGGPGDRAGPRRPEPAAREELVQDPGELHGVGELDRDD